MLDPLLFPSDCGFSSYHGYIESSGQQYFIRIQKNVAGQPSFLIECDAALREILAEHRRTVKQILDRCSSVEDFILELKEILDRVEKIYRTQCSPARSVAALFGSEFLPRIVSEIQSVGWERLTEANDSLSRLTFTCT
jgi:hypothetical protein